MKYLRTLTEKSTLQFGKYADMPIGQIIDLQHTRYLRWVYYNFSMINFTDDILKHIHINEFYKIVKPGINKQLGEKLNNALFAWAANDPNDKTKSIRMMSHLKKVAKAKHIENEIAFKMKYHAKDILQSCNQGHTINKY